MCGKEPVGERAGIGFLFVSHFQLEQFDEVLERGYGGRDVHVCMLLTKKIENYFTIFWLNQINYVSLHILSYHVYDT